MTPEELDRMEGQFRPLRSLCATYITRLAAELRAAWTELDTARAELARVSRERDFLKAKWRDGAPLPDDSEAAAPLPHTRQCPGCQAPLDGWARVCPVCWSKGWRYDPKIGWVQRL